MKRHGGKLYDKFKQIEKALTPDVCLTLYPQLASVGKQLKTDSPETSSVMGTTQRQTQSRSYSQRQFVSS